MKRSDLFEINPFPAVIQAHDVATLRQKRDPAAIADFTGGYLGFDERARHALQETLGSLASERGGAFFLNGVFGSGKSHLLGLLSLLSDGLGREAFGEIHPHLKPQLARLPRAFVVHFSLDEYDAARFPLETIVKREIEREYECLFKEKPSLPQGGTRGEYFQALEELLRAKECRSLVIAIDELSLFLSAKDHRALQADAAWLQFLGQRAARETPCPLHLFAALQKTVDDIGDLEAYSLSQIRDRFTTLQLSLAHLPSLIEQRLIRKKNAEAVRGLCGSSFEELGRALPRLDFGRQEWEQLYPFHPATVMLLENAVSRFFSRTRSAALFCCHSAREYLQTDCAPGERILPDALFDYLRPELENHPDLRSLSSIWNAWQENLNDLAGDAPDAANLRRLMKALLLFKIAGRAPDVVQLTNAAALDTGLSGDKNYEYVRLLLERLRTRGSYLIVERGEGELGDRYTVDHAARISELARRQVRSTLQELQPRDARITQWVLSCCQSEPLPLATLTAPRSFTLNWLGAPREAGVELWARALTPAQLGNRAAMLGQPGGQEDFLLLIAPPFDATPREPLSLLDLPGERQVRAAVVLWEPRLPTDDEWQLAREMAAAHLLEDDPQLLDNRRGRAILEHLKNAANSRQNTAARLAARLLREGRVTTAAGLAVEAAELAAGESWQSCLEAIAEITLPHVFERFPAIAPRARVLTPSNADQLCLEILRRPVEEPFYAPSHERLVRALAEPLGIARAVKGRWQITAPREELKEVVLEAAQGGVTLPALEAHFRWSSWGLKNEQLSLLICALLRTGELVALDARGQLLEAAKIGMPLRRSVHTVRGGALPSPKEWAHVQEVVRMLSGGKPGALSFEEQNKVRTTLAAWREEKTAVLELAQARINQLRRALDKSAAPWPSTESTLREMAALLEDTNITSGTLHPLLALSPKAVRETVTAWQALAASLESGQGQLLSLHALLTHPDIQTPPELQEERHQLLAALETGEEILENTKLPEDANSWCERYAATYRDWHAGQNDTARWSSLRRLLHSDELRALERLERLQSRTFTQGTQLRTAIEAELQKQCPRDGSLFPAEATCNACRLRHGARVQLADVRELQNRASAALTAFHAMLREETVRGYLCRHDAARELMEWQGEGDLSSLLTDEVLTILETAFKPRRKVTRSLMELSDQLKNCRTRTDYESTFKQWLSGEAGLEDEDEIILSE